MKWLNGERIKDSRLTNSTSIKILMDELNSSNLGQISPKRLRIFKIVSIGLGLLMAFFFAEWVTRVYYFGMDAFSYTKVNSFIPIGESGFLIGAENNKVLYELKPNIDSYFKLKKFNTNSQGQRDKEYSIVKPDNTIRGLVLGDSFTMGSGVEIEDVYHSVVENALNERSDGITYEMINFGVGGYNLLNYLGLLEEKVARYDPDFIIIGYCAFNDYFLPSEMHYKGKYEVKIQKEGRKQFFSFYLGGLIDRSLGSSIPSQMFDMQSDQVSFMDDMFGKFSAFSEANNIPIIINVLSLLPDNGNDAKVQELAMLHNLPIVDSFDKINYEKESSYIISKLDHHPNAKANKIYAQSLLEFDKFQEVVLQRSQVLTGDNQ
jgi:hypothetical protein